MKPKPQTPSNGSKSQSIKSKTFVKKKIKPGRVLHHDNFTDTRFKSKSIVISEQLHGGAEQQHHRQKSTIADFCRMLSHQNEKIVRSAICGIKAIASENKEELVKALPALASSLFGLLALKELNSDTGQHLVALLDIVLSLEEPAIRPHLAFLTGNVLAGLTSHLSGNFVISFDTLALLMKRQPKLISQSRELFDQFLASLDGSEWRLLGRQKLLSALELFLETFSRTFEDPLWPTVKIHVSTDDRQASVVIAPFPAAIEFSISETGGLNSTQKPKPLLSDTKTFVTFSCVIAKILLQLAEGSDTKYSRRCFNLVDKLATLVVQMHGSGSFSAEQSAELRASFSPLVKAELLVENRLSFLPVPKGNGK